MHELLLSIFAATCRLAALGGDSTAGEDVEAFCERLVSGCGVLLLPSTVYDHGLSSARGHFRIGLGRRDLPECLKVLRGFLREQEAQLQQEGQL